MKKTSLLISMIFLLSIGISAQVTYNIGGHQILKERQGYIELYPNDSVLIDTSIFVVAFKPSREEEGMKILGAQGFGFKRRMNSGKVAFTPPEHINFIDAFNALTNNAEISKAGLNYIRIGTSYLINSDIPDDQHVWDYWELKRSRIAFNPDYPEIPYAWQLSVGHPSVKVAILDDGLYWDDADFAPDNGLGYNYWNQNDDTNPISGFASHGTEAASIIAARTGNQHGLCGIAGGNYPELPPITLMIQKVAAKSSGIGVVWNYDDYRTSLAIEDAVNNGARIIHFAWGSLEPPVDSYIDDALSYADDNDVIVIAAAGNQRNTDHVSWPASREDVICVSASNSDDDLFWEHGVGSNKGAETEITFPGSQIEVVQYPDSFTTFRGTGTSISCAMATGVVALMLSVNPCLTKQEVRDILKQSCEQIGGYNYNWNPDNPGHSREMGYGLVNAYTAVSLAMAHDHMTINSGMDVTIDYDLNQSGNITVESGGILRISNCYVKMYPETKIIVKPGAKLYINGSTISSYCQRSWEGIEVWGNSSQHQFVYGNNQYYQGYVSISNATISNARNAVNLWKPGDYSKTGGIVIAANSSFINNRESIRALSYRNFHPVNGSEMGYIAIIKNCVFEVNDDYFGDYEFFKHVDLANVRGPQFLGCDFSLSSGAPNVNSYNHAIAAYNAGFTVNAFCTSSTVPCTVYDRCKFAGFRYAISANPVGRTSRSFFVNRAEFENNIFGIQVNGIDNFIVVNSNFKVGSATLPFCSFGIYMEESNGFAIEENEFSKTQSTLSSNNTGIYTKSTNGEDEIYKNRFINLTSGNYCEGFNYKDDYWTGLQFLCNQNTGNFADFYVKKLDTMQGDAIQAMQGNTSLPAANTFSPNAIWHFFNGGDNLVGYYYSSASFEYPTWIHNVTREFVSTPPSNLCVSNYGTDDPREKIILSDQEKLEQEYNFATASIDYANVKNIYDRLTDGGSTENTLYDVSSATTSNMLAVKNDLLSLSPHLSEEVLRLLAQKTDVFPDIAVFDVLAANPDELKKTELIRFLEEKDNPLPEYMIGILRQVAEGSSYKTLLQLEMTKFSRNRTKSANTIIRSILNSETVDYTDLRNWLENLGGIEADKQIISSHMDEMNYAAASNLAQTLATKYNLQGEELVDINAFNECLNIWIAVKTSDREFNELTEEETATLENIITNDSLSSAGSFAQSMITAYDSRFDYKCPEFETPELKHHEIDYRKLAEDQGFLVAVNPNPAKDWVSFDYTLPEDISSGIIEIRDLKGILIDKLIINGTKGQIIWNAAALPAGSYFYTAKAEKLTHSGKIVIVK
jgi:hypothetical protein